MGLGFSKTEMYRCIPLLRASPMFKFLRELWFIFNMGEYDDMQQAASFMQTVAAIEDLHLTWTLWDVIDKTLVGFNALSALALTQMLDGLSGKTIKYINIMALGDSEISVDSENFPVVSSEKIVTTFEHVSISLPILGWKHFRLWAIGSFNASPEAHPARSSPTGRRLDGAVIWAESSSSGLSETRHRFTPLQSPCGFPHKSPVLVMPSYCAGPGGCGRVLYSLLRSTQPPRHDRHDVDDCENPPRPGWFARY
ncbi:hypothetical protein NEOLEDRAFT_797812 [Neolentinus lepideus HHB14362 ss-1]|uniref:Uncharacterized protein n=1 Tax=Neolentinus lepideus HHB14362 ss-1 TaxID=1314782 RepID=A0A165PHD2_9AGAM|nr:hypothetical protein NEOLEDRAFT_797812 [Neolentinus lepideus HHB14362 ss-1]